jgi:hypothetical protein
MLGAGGAELRPTFRRIDLPLSSWPRLSRPSTPCLAAKQDVDARDKPGHDESGFAKAGMSLSFIYCHPRERACEEISPKTGTIRNRYMYKPESDREPRSISSHTRKRGPIPTCGLDSRSPDTPARLATVGLRFSRGRHQDSQSSCIADQLVDARKLGKQPHP